MPVEPCAGSDASTFLPGVGGAMHDLCVVVAVIVNAVVISIVVRVSATATATVAVSVIAVFLLL